MSNKAEKDGVENIDKALMPIMSPPAEVKTPNNLSKAESLDNPSAPRLRTIIENLMETRELQVLAGIIVLTLIIIGGTVFYEFSDFFWTTKPIRIAKNKCKEYTKYACDHPLSSNSSQIVLGEFAAFGMYPHMAFIEFEVAKSNSSYRKCAGSLISENFVLSAAHCLENDLKVSTRVSLGILDISVHRPYYWVKNAYTHPLFNSSSYEYDFLLLELSENVTFKPYLRPICLNTEYLGKYDRIVATGWGFTEDGKFSKILKSVDLVIDGVVGEKCTEALSSYSPDHIAQLICAGWPNSSRGAHSGDAGGPLQVISDSQCSNTYVQIGVMSVSQEPSDNLNLTLLSLYGKVATVVPWIASTVWSNESA